MKLKKLDITRVTRDAFANMTSYTAGLYAVTIINNMIDRANQGDIIFEYEHMIRPEFELRFDEHDTFESLVIRDSENCVVCIVGDSHLDGKIYCTKQHIREYFKLWRVAKIVNVNRVIDLCK